MVFPSYMMTADTSLYTYFANVVRNQKQIHKVTKRSNTIYSPAWFIKLSLSTDIVKSKMKSAFRKLKLL